ncbi:MAG: Lon protease family protein [Spirochaetota bacterium]
MADLDFSIHEITYEEASFSYSEKHISRYTPATGFSDIIGQPRAAAAIEMGIQISGKGYNIFVSGESGSGRTTAIQNILKKQPFRPDRLRDIALVHNFIKPENPIPVYLTPGRGQELVLSMRSIVHTLKEYILDSILQGTATFDGEKLSELIRPETDKLRSKYSDSTMSAYLAQVLLDIETSGYVFNGLSAEMVRTSSFFNRYSVNLLVDHSTTSTNPIVVENHPTFTQLIGSIDPQQSLPFLAIHAGSLLEASGGFLVLDAEEILKEEHLWDKIKQILKTSRLSVQNPTSTTNQSSSIRPEPIEVDIKVLMLGSDDMYDYLYSEDPDFHKLFKVTAEFDFSMPSNSENIGKYLSYIDMITGNEQLLPVDTAGKTEILRYGSYLAEHREELSTQFSLIADLIRESHYQAVSEGAASITAGAVKAAQRARNYLSSLTEAKITEQILAGEMLVHLEGSKVGVVNALAVLDRGYYSFGIPAVISATVAPGSEGIVNIEHEAGLSGEIHDKGLLILEGYLRKMYARNFPLSIYAGICFEQSYAEVDGDSASSSELYALLSAVGDIPIRQEISVTGSVNQMGEIQPVGGINEKITGFFRICSRKGLSGHQGVIIPRKNIRNLILPEDVLNAISRRAFHIYPIDTIDDGMQILTLRKAGERGAKGTFPPNTVNRIIEDRLKHLSSLSRQNN